METIRGRNESAPRGKARETERKIKKLGEETQGWVKTFKKRSHARKVKRYG